MTIDPIELRTRIENLEATIAELREHDAKIVDNQRSHVDALARLDAASEELNQRQRRHEMWEGQEFEARANITRELGAAEHRLGRLERIVCGDELASADELGGVHPVLRRLRLLELRLLSFTMNRGGLDPDELKVLGKLAGLIVGYIARARRGG